MDNQRSPPHKQHHCRLFQQRSNCHNYHSNQHHIRTQSTAALCSLLIHGADHLGQYLAMVLNALLESSFLLGYRQPCKEALNEQLKPVSVGHHKFNGKTTEPKFETRQDFQAFVWNLSGAPNQENQLLSKMSSPFPQKSDSPPIPTKTPPARFNVVYLLGQHNSLFEQENPVIKSLNGLDVT